MTITSDNEYFIYIYTVRLRICNLYELFNISIDITYTRKVAQVEIHKLYRNSYKVINNPNSINSRPTKS